MNKTILVLTSAIFLSSYFTACNSASADNNFISTDSATIAKGKVLFNQQCSGCHNFRQDGIGPQLSGLTAKVSFNWILDFIKNPQQLISSKDERAHQSILY